MQSLRPGISIFYSLFAVLLVGMFCCFAGETEARAQTLKAQIKVISLNPARLRVNLELPASTTALSFPNTYAGVLGLGERIDGVVATFEGQNVPIRKLAAGEYRAQTKFTQVSYDVDVAVPAKPAQMSHVSWLNKENGVLMLADLLPRSAKALRAATTTIKLEVPVGWTVASNLAGGEGENSTGDPVNAVFVIGALIQRKTRRIGATDVSLVTAGSWPFNGDDALGIVEKIIKEYSSVTGQGLKSNAVVMLLPFFPETGPERWTAETRGNAVVLLLGKQASKKRVLAKLGIVLSHEIFHLWVPNALALPGDYDWFFEGFTLYQALRTALRLKLISFDTFLETIARVYDSYQSSSDKDRLSLIEASEQRWTSASSLVYDKGMLAAFIYDLAMRKETNCRQSLDDVYRQLFRQHGTGQGSANETIIKLLNQPSNMDSFGREYLEGKGGIDLQSALWPYGIQVHLGSSRAQATKLGVAKQLSSGQANALRCIGYRG
jgi:predicted metalloprotease with PDZ domain